MRWAPSGFIMRSMSARDIKVTVERNGLAHVDVFTWDHDAEDMGYVRAGSIENGVFRGYGGVSLTDEERAFAMKAAK